MKVRVEADGSMEFEISSDDDASAAMELVRLIKSDGSSQDPPVRSKNAARLSPKLLEVFEVISAYPDGIHYSQVAEFVGLAKTATNSRCNSLNTIGLVQRVASGVYKPVVK